MKKVIFTITTAIVLLCVLEIISRVTLNHIYNRKLDPALIVDNKYLTSSGLKENAAGCIWGKPFHTNQFGCRKSLKPYSAKKKKWLFIGDSVTEGVGVDDSSTFAAIVAQNMDSVNILNYSLIGYTDANYLDVIKTLLNNGDSSIQKVTIFFSLSDVYGKTKRSHLPPMAKRNIWGYINKMFQDEYGTYKLIKLLAYQNTDRYFQYDSKFYKAGGEYFDTSMNYLKQCNEVCKNAGVEMNVVMLPYRAQLVARDEKSRIPQNLVKSFCFTQHIPFADPIDFCKKASNTKDLYLFADEIHFSNAGHKMIADYILTH